MRDDEIPPRVSQRFMVMTRQSLVLDLESCSLGGMSPFRTRIIDDFRITKVSVTLIISEKGNVVVFQMAYIIMASTINFTQYLLIIPGPSWHLCTC